MSIRSRLVKAAVSTGVATALLVGAPLAANACTQNPTYFVTNQRLSMANDGAKYDVVMGASSRAMSVYKFEGWGFRNYDNWVIEIKNMRTGAIDTKITGNAYLMNYVAYNLENHSTNAWVTAYSSLGNLRNLLKQGSSMGAAQLKDYAQHHTA